MTQYAQKTMRQKYAKSEEYALFKHNIYVCDFLPLRRNGSFYIALCRKCNFRKRHFHLSLTSFLKV